MLNHLHEQLRLLAITQKCAGQGVLGLSTAEGESLCT